MCEEEEQLLTTSQAAKFLEVSDSSVKRWIDSGKLLARKTAGGHRRISTADLKDFRATFYPGIETDRPIKTKKLDWSSDENMIAFFRESMISGDPYSMEKAIRSRKDFPPYIIFDRFLYPAFLSIRAECYVPDPDCNVISRSLESSKKCTSFLQRPSALHRSKSLVLADIGDHLDSLPTFLAEACAYGHYKPVQLGSDVEVVIVEKAIKNLNPDLFFLSGKGSKAVMAFEQISAHLNNIGSSVPMVTIKDSAFADKADMVFHSYEELHGYLKANEEINKSINE